MKCTPDSRSEAHPHDYQGRIPDRLPVAVVRQLSVLRPGKALGALAEEWAGIVAAIALCQAVRNPLLYAGAVIWIGARQHALTVLGHDAVHYRFLPGRQWNDWVANLFAEWPTFITVEGFRHYHGEHHRFTGMPGDGNREIWRTHTADGRLRKEWTFPKSAGALAMVILRRVAVFTGAFWIVRGLLSMVLFRPSWFHVVARLAFYALGISAFAAAGALPGFVRYWIVPYCTWHMACQYGRLICEHSAVPGIDAAYAITRTTLARRWERWLILPRNIHYHIEHHWYPSVPFYNLPALHTELMKQPGFQQRAVVTKSVFASLRQCLVGDGAMISRGLFSAAILYFIGQWLVSFLRRHPARPVTHHDGERDGSLVHRYVHVDRTLVGKPTDVTFHYVEAGATERECVVFLHGFMDTWRLWRAQLDAFADRFRVVAFDLKGAGQSSKAYPRALFPEVNDGGGDYELHMQADELVAALEHIGVRRFHLVTLDLGTVIGDILAGRYPERILGFVRCQQPLVGHFHFSIRQGRFLRHRKGARIFTAMLEPSPGALLRVLYGRTGWRLLDRSMRRTKNSMPAEALHEAVREASHPFPHGPRAGRPATFACSWAGLYQHNRDYMAYLRNNLEAYRKYIFPVLLVQGVHDIAMPPNRFDGSTGMALKQVRGNVILSRPFGAGGRGLDGGFRPWAGLITGCDRPLRAEEFFPHAPSVALKFVDTGHFIPLEAPDVFTELLENFLNRVALEKTG